MESKPISFHTEPRAVAQALVAIARTEFTNIGYDPTIITPTAVMPVLAPILPSNPWNRTIRTVVEDGGKKVAMNLIIDTCLFSSHSVQGRGTHVFACLHPKYQEYLKKAKVHEEGSNQKGKGKGKGKGTAEVDPEPGYSGWPPFISCALQIDNLLQTSPTASSKIAGWIMRPAVITTSTISSKKGI
jgi:hypothetical protein